MIRFLILHTRVWSHVVYVILFTLPHIVMHIDSFQSYHHVIWITISLMQAQFECFLEATTTTLSQGFLPDSSGSALDL